MERMPLSGEVEESRQKLFANIRGQIGFRACRCDICHRDVYASLYGGQKNGVDLALIRSAHDHCHARDLSALIDIAGRDDEEVGILGNERVQVGQHIVLPDEAMGPADGVEGASHHLAPVVDACGKGGTISRQNAEVCGCAACAVPPNSGKDGCAVRARDIPNNLAVVINGIGVTSSKSEVWKLEGSVVLPQYRVVRYVAAVSRGAYGLASIVDALYEAVWVANQGRKRSGFAFFPKYRRNNLSRLARRASGVLDRRFRNAHYLSAVIDSTGLPVITAQRRESHDVAVSPKKRATRKVCAKAAKVFTVWIWNRCFGQTDSFPAIVDPAIVGPTVLSSKRAEVDVEPVDAYHRAATCDGRGGRSDGRVYNSIHVLCPAEIIESHDHAEVVRAFIKAQIGNLVALLSECSAGASQNSRRNTRYPEIAQLS